MVIRSGPNGGFNMPWKTGLVLSVAALGVMAWSPDFGVAPAFAACRAGDKIVSSTARQAAAKMQLAGYGAVHVINKGCDNYWHALAMSGGQQVQIVLSPAGKVMLAGKRSQTSENVSPDRPSEQSAQSQ
jgi:hypothetical protein